jgi:acetyltransferase
MHAHRIAPTTDAMPAGSPHAVRVRRVDALDTDGLAQFYANLSVESRYSRFLGTTRGIQRDASRGFCDPDHEHAEGFVAALNVAGPDEGRIVGHVCLLAAGEGTLELAIAVADAFQRCGVGRRLLEAALAWARQRGFRAVIATALAANGSVLHLLASGPLGSTISQARSGTVSVRIPLRL